MLDGIVEPEKLDIDQLVAFWLSEADEALTVSDHLVEKKDFSYALFFGHLAIEKILKALYSTNINDKGNF